MLICGFEACRDLDFSTNDFFMVFVGFEVELVAFMAACRSADRVFRESVDVESCAETTDTIPITRIPANKTDLKIMV